MKKLLVFNPTRFRETPELYFYSLVQEILKYKSKEISAVECNESNYREVISGNSFDFAFFPRCYGVSLLLNALKNKNVLKIVQMDDLHYFNNETRIKLQNNFNFADVILLPYYYHFLSNPEYKKYYSKAIYFPFAVTDEITKIEPVKGDNGKVLLSGCVSSHYSFRKALANFAVNNPHLDHLRHPGYGKLSHNVIGIAYYKYISKYLGAISTSADKPLDYPLMKYFEIPGCKVIPLFERNNYLADLGFVKNKNFIEINNDNYKKIINPSFLSDNKSIIDSAYNLVLNNHLMSSRAAFLYRMLETGSVKNWEIA